MTFPAKVIRCCEWRKRLRNKPHIGFTKRWERLRQPMDHVEMPQPSAHGVHLQQDTKKEVKVLHRRHHMCLWKRRRNHGTHVTELPTLTNPYSLDDLITFNDVGKQYVELRNKQTQNDTIYKRWSCHSGYKLLCKLCRTQKWGPDLPFFGQAGHADSLDGWRCSS